MKRTMLFIMGMALSAAVAAAELAGVKLADRLTLAGSELVLNGAAVRRTPMADIYVGALYLPRRQSSPAGVMEDRGPRRLQMAFLVDAPAEQLVGSFVGGLSKNHGKPEMEAMKAEVEQLVAIIRSIGQVSSGQSLLLDFVPGRGPVISHDSAAKGSISGDAFHDALLRIWLGENPPSPDMKKAMLGN